MSIASRNLFQDKARLTVQTVPRCSDNIPKINLRIVCLHLCAHVECKGCEVQKAWLVIDQPRFFKRENNLTRYHADFIACGIMIVASSRRAKLQTLQQTNSHGYGCA